MPVQPEQSLPTSDAGTFAVSPVKLPGNFVNHNADAVSRLMQSIDQPSSGPPVASSAPNGAQWSVNSVAASIRCESEKNFLAMAKLGLAKSLSFALLVRRSGTAEFDQRRLAFGCPDPGDRRRV